MSGVSQDNWSEWLALPEKQSIEKIIERNVEKGLPCGGSAFIDQLELVAKNHFGLSLKAAQKNKLKGSGSVPFIPKRFSKSIGFGVTGNETLRQSYPYQ